MSSTLGRGGELDRRVAKARAARPAAAPARPLPRPRCRRRARRPAASLAQAWISSVDLPMPGSPPSRMTDPGTKPPPVTRSSSATPLGGARRLGARRRPEAWNSISRPLPALRAAWAPMPEPAVLLDDRVPAAAGVAAPLPAVGDRAAVLADEGVAGLGHCLSAGVARERATIRGFASAAYVMPDDSAAQGWSGSRSRSCRPAGRGRRRPGAGPSSSDLGARRRIGSRADRSRRRWRGPWRRGPRQGRARRRRETVAPRPADAAGPDRQPVRVADPDRGRAARAGTRSSVHCSRRLLRPAPSASAGRAPCSADHRAHRVGQPGRGIAAVERVAGPHQVEHRTLRQEDAGGIGQRGRKLAQRALARMLEAGDLPRIDRLRPALRPRRDGSSRGEPGRRSAFAAAAGAPPRPESRAGSCRCRRGCANAARSCSGALPSGLFPGREFVHRADHRRRGRTRR